MTIAPGLLFFQLLRIVLASAMAVCYYALFGRIWLRIPLRPRRMVLCVVINTVATVVRTLGLGGSVISTLAMAVGMLSAGLILLQPWRGWRNALCLIVCFGTEYLLEFVGNWLYLLICPNAVTMMEVFGSQIIITEPVSLLVLFPLEALLFAVPLTIIALLRRPGRLAAREERVWPFWLHVLFSAALLVAMAIICTVIFNSNLYRSITDSTLLPYLNDLRGFAYFLPAVLILLFFWELVQQYTLFSRNRALAHQNKAYQNILDSTREFRHNIANLIYGFEGVILTENLPEIRRYYEELARRCLLNNNENADALNHVSDPALTALLLRKSERASEMRIPLYLTAEPGFGFRSIQPAALTEALGVLLDNALEAAARSASPRVDVTLYADGNCSALMISNTFAPDADLSFMQGEARSSKPGHQATGLASARRVLARYPDICFNQYLRGRYVESNLTEYRAASL